MNTKKTPYTFILAFNLFISYSLQAQDRDSGLTPERTEDTSISNDSILGDLIIVGKVGLGDDIKTDTDFGFNTMIFRENNLRVFFDDTSRHSDFPFNDWMFEFNDTTNGGDSYFQLVDETHNNVPFKVMAGAPNNTIFIESNGTIGFGTDSPNSDASLHLSANNKGLLLNQLTTSNRNTLGNNLDIGPEGQSEGMLVYDTDDDQIYFWNGTGWVNPGVTGGTDDQTIGASLSGTTLTISIEDGNSLNVNLAAILEPLQSQISDLTSRLETLEACACDGNLKVPEFDNLNKSGIILNQNIPNPFESSTRISYYIPENYTKAHIKFTTALGQELFSVPLTKFGGTGGEINIDKSQFNYQPNNVYFYTLYVEGTGAVTRKLMLK